MLNGVEAFGVFEGLGTPRTRREINERTEMIFNQTRDAVNRMMMDERLEIPEGPADMGTAERSAPIALEDFMGDVDLRAPIVSSAAASASLEPTT